MANAKVIARATTRLARLRIEQSGDERWLKFERDTDAIQTAINQHAPHRLVMENLVYLMGILLFIPPPRSILILGTGGGSLVQYCRHYLPDAHITAVEYDEELFAIAREHLFLPPASPTLTYVIDEARRYINGCDEQFDLVLIDIFDGGETPAWMLEKSFIDQIKQRLTPQGAVAFNLLIENEKIFKRYYKLLRECFSRQTLCLETEEYANLLVYALNFSPPIPDMGELLQRCEALNPKYDLPFNSILATIFSINPQDSGII